MVVIRYFLLYFQLSPDVPLLNTRIANSFIYTYTIPAILPSSITPHLVSLGLLGRESLSLFEPILLNHDARLANLSSTLNLNLLLNIGVKVVRQPGVTLRNLCGSGWSPFLDLALGVGSSESGRLVGPELPEVDFLDEVRF